MLASICGQNVGTGTTIFLVVHLAVDVVQVLQTLEPQAFMWARARKELGNDLAEYWHGTPALRSLQLQRRLAFPIGPDLTKRQGRERWLYAQVFGNQVRHAH